MTEPFRVAPSPRRLEAVSAHEVDDQRRQRSFVVERTRTWRTTGCHGRRWSSARNSAGFRRPASQRREPRDVALEPAMQAFEGRLESEARGQRREVAGLAAGAELDQRVVEGLARGSADLAPPSQSTRPSQSARWRKLSTIAVRPSARRRRMRGEPPARLLEAALADERQRVGHGRGLAVAIERMEQAREAAPAAGRGRNRDTSARWVAPNGIPGATENSSQSVPANQPGAAGATRAPPAERRAASRRPPPSRAAGGLARQASEGEERRHPDDPGEQVAGVHGG